ncbi:hypothetical protein E6P97_00715 [Patescibacteria group bacterium]|nr:MAG: hypothetical protein E6P97_00715 [Patescibacteria group bacterium]
MSTLTLTEAEAYESICWSADVDSPEKLLATVDRMPKLRVIKIDRQFVDDHGWEIFDELRDRDLKVFDDAKIIEIPVKLAGVAAVHVRKARPWMLNCMAGGLSNRRWTKREEKDELDGLKRFADVCHEAGVRPCGVTVLTSKDDDTVIAEFGRPSIDQVLFYVGMLNAAGFTDVVCSPNEVAAIRQELAFAELDLNTPGIRPEGAANQDQARVGTPKGTLAIGANRLVIGRPLTNGDPAENLDNIVAEILAA